MTFRLIIDTREKGSVATELNHLNVDYSVEPLSVGDFAIKDENILFVGPKRMLKNVFICYFIAFDIYFVQWNVGNVD